MPLHELHAVILAKLVSDVTPMKTRFIHCIPVIDAALGEILTTCSKMEWLIKFGEAALRPETRRGNLVLSYKRSEVHYEPSVR